MAQLQNKEDTTTNFSALFIQHERILRLQQCVSWLESGLLLALCFRIYMKNSADRVSEGIKTHHCRRKPNPAIYKLVGKYNNRTILIVWRGTSCQGLRKWRGGLENLKSIFSFRKWNHEVTNEVLVKIDNFSQISWEVAANKLTSFRFISK